MGYDLRVQLRQAEKLSFLSCNQANEKQVDLLFKVSLEPAGNNSGCNVFIAYS